MVVRISSDEAEAHSRLIGASGSPGAFIQVAMDICRENGQQIIRELRDIPEARTLHELVRNRTRAALKEAGGWPNAQVLGQIVSDAFEEACVPLISVASTVRAILWAVEHQFLDTLVVEYAGQGRFELQPHQWFVLPEPNLVNEFHRQYGVRPHLGPRKQALDIWADRPASTTRVGPYEPVSQAFTVQVDATHIEALGEVLAGIPTAAAINPVPPNTERHEVPFGYGPKDSRPVWQEALNRLSAVGAEDVRIAVLPELCLRDDVVPDLTAHEPVPGLVVTGSQHQVNEAGHRVNCARLHLRGEEVLSHEKMVPFGARDPEGNPLAGDLIEDIDPATEVTVLFSKRWTLAVLICADIHSQDLVHTLERLGVNLLMIPSLTSRIGLFRTTLSDFCLRQQALIIWVNDNHLSPDVQSVGFFFPFPEEMADFSSPPGPSTTVTKWTWDI